MKQITIRDLEDAVIHRLKKIAWAEGVPPDETARRLLIEAIQSRTAAHPIHYRHADSTSL
jgi:plasmid stability protein